MYLALYRLLDVDIVNNVFHGHSQVISSCVGGGGSKGAMQRWRREPLGLSEGMFPWKSWNLDTKKCCFQHCCEQNKHLPIYLQRGINHSNIRTTDAWLLLSFVVVALVCFSGAGRNCSPCPWASYAHGLFWPFQCKITAHSKEGNNCESQQTSKELTKTPRFMFEDQRPRTTFCFALITYARIR